MDYNEIMFFKKIVSLKPRSRRGKRKLEEIAKVPKTKKTRKMSRYAGKLDVNLVKGKGSSKTGGEEGGFFWWVFYKEVKAGKIFINYYPELNQASIQIFLNKKSQGKGIGRLAYEKACKESGYDRVYAEMRKNNFASIKAALAAGFVIVKGAHPQIKMVWSR